MKLEIAEVTSNFDQFEMGVFYVNTASRTADLKVYYASPYLAGQDGGFVAIPEKGSRVLICQPDNDNAWYYLGTTTNFGLANSNLTSESVKKDKGVLPDNRIYKARGVPQRLVLKSPKGSSLTLSDEYNPEYFNLKAELKTPSGKSVKLVDSSNVDCVIVENEHGDRIRISSNGNDAMAPRSIEVECKGPVNITTRESSLNLTVVDGKELNIVNNSTGSKRANSNDPTPGNINIVSENADINVTTKDDTGTIFVETEGANSHIVLKSKGTIDIQGEKGVNITAANGNVIVQGTQIHLN